MILRILATWIPNSGKSRFSPALVYMKLVSDPFTSDDSLETPKLQTKRSSHLQLAQH